jgi:hypothetical protein
LGYIKFGGLSVLADDLLASQELWPIIFGRSVKLPHVIEPEVTFMCVQQRATLNAEIKSLRATLPAEIFLLEILIFKELTARRLGKSFGVQ